MGDAVQIDRHLFHERLTHFVNHWKNDRRSGDAVFGGAPSFSLVLGKAEEAMGSHKNGAFQVTVWHVLASASSLANRLCPSSGC